MRAQIIKIVNKKYKINCRKGKFDKMMFSPGHKKIVPCLFNRKVNKQKYEEREIPFSNHSNSNLNSNSHLKNK